ncbi:MAG: hypothetical protein AAGJ70_01445 [Pseudomonadota bacterium]
MFDYGEMLRYLADNPPGSEAERNVHASLLELIAACVRDDCAPSDDMHAEIAMLMEVQCDAPLAVEADPSLAMSPDQGDALAQLRRRYAGTFAAHAAFAAQRGEDAALQATHMN